MMIKKPAGFALVSPYIILRNVADTLNFYQLAFNFKIKEKFTNTQGMIEHAEMWYHDQVLLFGAENDLQRLPLTSGHVCAIYCYVYCHHLDDLISTAIRHGAVIKQTAQLQPWGDYTAQLQDIEGYWWTFAEQRHVCKLNQTNT